MSKVYNTAYLSRVGDYNTSYRNHVLKGLHLQIILLTPKLNRLPSANPATKQKLATVAAMSTSSALPSSLGLCSNDDADIKQRLDTYPFDNPNKPRMTMNNKSELMIGSYTMVAGPRWMLHIKKIGMNSVRASDKARSRLPDHTSSFGNEQTYRPKKSPTLKTRKWIAAKSSGWVFGFVGLMDIVIGGNTA